MLTQEQRAHFDTFGFLLFRRAFTADEMTELTIAAEEVWEESATPERNGERRLCYFVESRPSLSRLVTHDRIHPVVTKLMGPDFVWIGSEGNISARSRAKWHADRKYYRSNEERCCDFPQMKVMIYLQKVTRDSGCLRVIPGSHRMPYHKDLAPQEIDPEARPFGLDPQDISCVCLESDPGDIIMFHHMIWHAQFGGGDERRYIALKFAARPSAEHHMKSLERYSPPAFKPHEAFLNHEDPRIRAMVQPLAGSADVHGS